jgi:hypothetical protein
MNQRRLLILAAVAIVAVCVAVLLANRTATTPRDANELLYPDLKAQAESVKAIRVFKAGDERAVEIVRNGDHWTLTERNGYPIADAKARNLVRALAGARILEEKTSDPDKFAALALEDVSGADAKGIRIELEGPSQPVNLIVGKDGLGKSSYVRRAGESQSWLVNEQLSASAEPRDWLDKDIINVSADRVQSATLTIGNQKPYTAAKSSRADADFKVEPLPKGKELSSSGAANGFATALINLSMNDVKPKADIATGKPSAQATYTTFDGLVVRLEGYEKDDERYVTLTASYDAALAERFAVKTAADDASKDDTEKGEAQAEQPPAASKPQVAAEAQTIAAKLTDWAFEIPRYKYEAIFRPLDEMLK